MKSLRKRKADSARTTLLKFGVLAGLIITGIALLYYAYWEAAIATPEMLGNYPEAGWIPTVLGFVFLAMPPIYLIVTVGFRRTVK